MTTPDLPAFVVGKASDRVIAYHPNAAYPTAPRAMKDCFVSYSKSGRHPLAPDYFDRGRPVYAYPVVASYRGKGDRAVTAS